MLVLQARSQFIVDYIEDNYLDILSRVLRKVFGAQVQLEYRILMAGSSIDIPSDSMKLSAAPKVTIAPQSIVEIDNEWDSHLNPLYTFDNFIVGNSNRDFLIGVFYGVVDEDTEDLAKVGLGEAVFFLGIIF